MLLLGLGCSAGAICLGAGLIAMTVEIHRLRHEIRGVHDVCRDLRDDTVALAEVLPLAYAGGVVQGRRTADA